MSAALSNYLTVIIKLHNDLFVVNEQSALVAAVGFARPRSDLFNLTQPGTGIFFCLIIFSSASVPWIVELTQQD